MSHPHKYQPKLPIIVFVTIIALAILGAMAIATLQANNRNTLNVADITGRFFIGRFDSAALTNKLGSAITVPAGCTTALCAYSEVDTGFNYSETTRPRFAMGDLNGDKTPDLVSTSENHEYLTITTFDAAAKRMKVIANWKSGVCVSNNCNMYAIQVLDIDNNRLDDIVVYTIDKTFHNVDVFKQTDEGTFSKSQPLSLSASKPVNGYTNYQSINLGDVTSDGRADIIALSNGKIGIFAQQSNSTFKFLKEFKVSDYPIGVLEGNVPQQISIADVTNDGSKDLIVLGEGSGTYDAMVWKTINTDPIMLKTSRTLPGDFLPYKSIGIGDIDGKTGDDIIIYTSSVTGDTFIDVFWGGTLSKNKFDLPIAGLPANGYVPSTALIAVGNIDNDAEKEAILSRFNVVSEKKAYVVNIKRDSVSAIPTASFVTTETYPHYLFTSSNHVLADIDGNCSADYVYDSVYNSTGSTAWLTAQYSNIAPSLELSASDVIATRSAPRVNIKATIRNTGRNSACPFKVRVEALGTNISREIIITDLGAGKTTSLDTVLSGTGLASSTSVRVTIDPFNQIKEGNETNNSAIGRIN